MTIFFFFFSFRDEELLQRISFTLRYDERGMSALRNLREGIRWALIDV